MTVNTLHLNYIMQYGEKSLGLKLTMQTSILFQTLHITNSRVTLLKLVLYLMYLLISVSPQANVKNSEEI